MKTIFIVGFSASVRQVLYTRFTSSFDQGLILWISEGRGIATDIDKFKQVFFSRLLASRAKEILVITAIPPDQRWADEVISGLIGKARGQHTDRAIALDVHRDFGSQIPLANRIDGFGLPGKHELSLETVGIKLSGGKVICIVGAGKTSILEALNRVGISKEALSAYFEEEAIGGGRNSTLMEYLQGFAKTYDHMLYAWAGLRTSSGGLVRAFKRKGIFFEGDSAAKIAESMRKYLSS